MNQMTNQEIDTLCIDIMTRSEAVSYNTFALFQVLYYTGARLEELMGNNTISYDTNTHLLIYVQKKKQNVRTVILPFTTPNFDTNFFQLIHSAGEITPRTAQNHFSSLMNGKYLTREAQPISLHIFRYNFARKLIELGQTATQVASALGHQNPAYSLPYLYKPIYLNNY